MSCEDDFSNDAQFQQSPQDESLTLRLLLESSQRQEEFLAKACSLMEGLDTKFGQLATGYMQLEAAANRALDQAGAPTDSLKGAAPTMQRGSLANPPGRQSLSSQPIGRGPAPEDLQREQAEKLAAERKRVEDENMRRAEELARKQALEEQRRLEEEQRRRAEEERKRELELKRKQDLHDKTAGLMSGLISSAPGTGLFDDDFKPAKKGGLFDDDD